MLKKLCIILFFLYSGFYAVSQSVFGSKPIPIDPVVPLNPKTASQGFSFTANAFGYNSFFYNPAGFAVQATKDAITALSISTWIIGDAKFWKLIGNVPAFISNTQDLINNFKNSTQEVADGFQRIQNAANQNEVTAGFQEAVNGIKNITGTEETYAAVMNYLVTSGASSGTVPTYDDPNFITNITNWASENQSNLETILKNEAQFKQVATIAAETFIKSGAISKIFNQIPSQAQAGLTLGFGYVNKGLGAGLMVNFDVQISTAGNLNALVSPTIMANAGYAFSLLDNKLLLGFNVRPMLIFSYFRLNVTQSTIQQILVNPANAKDFFPLSSGFGAGLDIGAIYKINENMNVGLVLKDAPTFFTMYAAKPNLNFSKDSVGGFFDKHIANLFYVPPNLAVGFSYRFKTESFPFSFTASAQIDDWIPQLVYKDFYGTEFDWLSLFKVGVSANIAKFLNVNAGYGARFLTAGLGLSFVPVPIEINFAVLYKPSNILEQNSFGFALEFAIRW